MGQLLENVFFLLVAEERNAGVLIAPDSVHDGERDEHAGGGHWLDLAELAAVDAAANDGAEKAQAAGYDFVGVELGEVGELVELAEHEAVDGAEDGRADEGPVAAHGGDELLGWRPLTGDLLSGLDGDDGGLPDHLAE